jgi:hypothetical protein
MHPSGKYQNDSEKSDQSSDKYENFAEFGHWLSLPQLRVEDRAQASVVSKTIRANPTLREFSRGMPSERVALT